MSPAPAARAGGPPGNSRPSDAVSANDLATLQKVHDANQMEVEMGHLAVAKATAKNVKEFGRKLVRDHAAADDQIGAFLKQRGLDVTALATTTSADPAHSTTADQGGASFDRSFVMQMIRDHQRTIDVVEAAINVTADAQLKAWYQAFLTVLRDHQQTAEALARSKGRV